MTRLDRDDEDICKWVGTAQHSDHWRVVGGISSIVAMKICMQQTASFNHARFYWIPNPYRVDWLDWAGNPRNEAAG